VLHNLAICECGYKRMYIHRAGALHCEAVIWRCATHKAGNNRRSIFQMTSGSPSSWFSMLRRKVLTLAKMSVFAPSCPERRDVQLFALRTMVMSCFGSGSNTI
jgi:hypothetical protein